MLKGINKIISPELLCELDRMGHGDEIVLSDGNFPGESMGVIIGRTKKLKYFNDSSVSVCNMSDRVDKLLKCAGIYTIVHKL